MFGLQILELPKIGVNNGDSRFDRLLAEELRRICRKNSESLQILKLYFSDNGTTEHLFAIGPNGYKEKRSAIAKKQLAITFLIDSLARWNRQLKYVKLDW